MTMPRRCLIRLTIATSMLGTARLSNAQLPPGGGDSAPRYTAGVAARDISGTWDGSFALDSAWQLRERPAARSVRARLQFRPVGDATPTTSSTRSVHPGTFDIDFSRFGFSLSTREALGWSASPGAFAAVLNPTVDHGVVELHGTIRSDSSVVGTWRYTSDPGGARGRFELRKAPGG